MGSQRWLAIGFVACSVLVGIAAYSIGLSQGAAHAAVAAGASSAEWEWHRHWGVGFPFGFFILFWFVLMMVRGVFWGGPWYRRRWHYDWDDDPRRFDEWHRRAHEQMQGQQKVCPSSSS